MKDLVDQLKSVPCADCGGTFPSPAMSFDHRDPDQKVGCVGHFIRTNDEAGLRAEIAKCDVVCMNCHAVRTKNQGMTARQRARVGEASKNAWARQTPEQRAERGQKVSLGKSASLKEQWKDPGFRAKMLAAQHTPEADAKRSTTLSQQTKERWADPEYKAHHSQGIRDNWATKVQSEEFNSEHSRALRRERAKKAWETRRVHGLDKFTDESKAKVSEAAKKAWETRRKNAG